MFNSTVIRPGYADTDQMGFVHHSNYAKYYEIARWEVFRNLGITYKSIENMGYLMPVVDLDMHFLKPAHYDDQIVIKTIINKLSGARLFIEYKAFVNDILINTAKTTLAVLNKETGKPCKIPDFIKSIFSY